MSQKVYLKKSAVVDKTPAASTVEFGELAINYASGSGKSFLATKKYDNTMAKFHEDAYNEAKFAGKSTFESYTATTDQKISSTSGAAVNALNNISAVSATVKSTYATKTEVGNASANTIVSAMTSAKTYVDNNFVKNQTFNDYKTLNDAAVKSVSGTAISAFTYASAISATVKTNFATHTEVGDASAHTIVSAMTSAKTYVDGNFVKNQTFNDYKTLNDATVKSVSGTAISAFTYASAISATVKTNFATHTEVGNASANTIVSASTSAKTYADNTFVTKDTYNGYTASTDSSISNLQTEVGKRALSATVKSELSAISQTIEDNEEVVTIALTNLNNRINGLSGYVESDCVTNDDLSAISSSLSSLSGRVVTINGNYATKAYADAESAAAVTKVVGKNTDASTADTVWGAKKYASGLTNSLSGDLITYVNGKETSLNASINAVKLSAITVSASVIELSGAVNTKLSTIYKYKGSKTNYSDLPQTGNEVGDTWNVVNANGNTPAGTNYSWTGSEWDALGGTIDLSGYASSAVVKGIKDSLEAADTALGDRITGMSGWVKSNYWTSAQTQGKIAAASAASVNSAYTAAVTSANSYTNALGTLFGSFSSTTNATISNIQTSARTLSATVVTLEKSAQTLNTKITTAKNEAVTSAFTAAVTSANNYTNALGTLFGSFSSTTNGAISNIQTSARTLSATVVTLEKSAKTLSTRITNMKDEAVTSAFTAAVTSANNYTNALGTVFGNYSSTTNATIDKLKSSATTLSGWVTDIYGKFADYATHTEVKNASGASIAKATASALTEGDKRYVSSAIYSTYVTTNDSNISKLKSSASTLSGWVTDIYTKLGNYATHTEVKNASGAAVATATASALTEGDKRYVSSATYASYVTTNDAAVQAAQTKANQAYNRDNATSATVKSTYWTSAQTRGHIDSASAAAVTASNNYANGKFLTKESAGTMYDALALKDVQIIEAMSAFSASVMSDYATETEASSYAAAALGNAMAYTDSKLTGYATSGDISSLSGQVITNTSDITTLKNATGNYVTTGTVQNITGGKSFASAITANGGVKVIAATSPGNSYRAIPYTDESDNTLVKYTWSNANSGLTYNPKLGLLKTAGYVINGKSANDLLNAAGGTTPAGNFATSSDLQTTNSKVQSAWTRADNAHTSANTIATNLKNGYWNSATTRDKIGVASAYTYGKVSAFTESTYVKKTTYNDYTATTDSTLSEYDERIEFIENHFALSSTMNTELWDIRETIEENEEVTSAALNDLNNRISGITSGYVTNSEFEDYTDANDAIVQSIDEDYMTKFSYVASGTGPGVWNVNIPNITGYSEGLTIHVVLKSPYSAVAAYNVLRVNNLDYKYVYYTRNNRLTSHFGNNYPEITLTYRSDASGGSYNAAATVSPGITQGQKYSDGWVAQQAYYTYTNPESIAYYERRYWGSNTYSYQIAGVGADERLEPMLTGQSSSTAATKTVNTKPFRPDQLYYYNGGTQNAGTVVGAQTLRTEKHTSEARYTFNSQIDAYRSIYLKGTYNNTTGLFTLDSTSYTSWYIQVPTNTANINLASYFTTGYYYVFVGASYSSNNYWQFHTNHVVYYFDGTNLIPVSKKYTDDKVSTINSNISTLSGNVVTINNNYASHTEVANASARTYNSAVTAAASIASSYTDTQINNLNIGQYATNSSLTALEGKFNEVSGHVHTIKGNYATKTFVGSASGYAYNQAKTDVIGAASNTSANTTIYGLRKYAEEKDRVLSGNLITYVNGKETTINGSINALKTSAFTLSGSVTALSASVINKLTTVMKYKGTVASCANLPATAETGDTYNVTNASGNTPPGTNWTYNGSGWDPLGGTIDLSNYATTGSVEDAKSKAQSAWTRADNAHTSASTIASNLANNYWKTGDTLTKIGVASAYTYGKVSAFTESTYAKKTAFESYTASTDSKISTLSGSVVDLSGSVVSNFATKAEASNYAAAAYGNSVDYTDSKISGLSIGNYLTVASATQIVTSLQSTDTELTNKVSKLTTNSGALQSQVSQLTTNSGALQNQVSQLTTNSGALQNQVSQLTTNSGSMYNTLTAATGNITALQSATGTLNTLLNKVNSSYVSAVTYTTAATDASISSNKLTIPKPRVLTITKNGTNLTTYDGSAAVTAATTDKMVQQENVATANYRPLLMASPSATAQASIATTTVTGTSYFNKEIYAQPSTGELGATQMKIGGHVTLQYNSTTQALDFIFS